MVTGASGVVGYNLCKRLLDIPYCDVHVNYLNPPGINFKNLLRASNHHVFDITDLDKIDTLPQFDVIFHCAIIGGSRLKTDSYFEMDCNLKMYYNLHQLHSSY